MTRAWCDGPRAGRRCRIVRGNGGIRVVARGTAATTLLLHAGTRQNGQLVNMRVLGKQRRNRRRPAQTGDALGRGNLCGVLLGLGGVLALEALQEALDGVDANAAVGEQHLEARVLNGHVARGLLHLQRRGHALCLKVLQLPLHALDVFFPAGPGPALVLSDADRCST